MRSISCFARLYAVTADYACMRSGAWDGRREKDCLLVGGRAHVEQSNWVRLQCRIHGDGSGVRFHNAKTEATSPRGSEHNPERFTTNEETTAGC